MLNKDIPTKEVVAIIPARGGSKGIPKKNLISVLGEPLISWTIKTALSCTKINRVIVSTDDEEIASISLNCGAEVPFIRPKEFAQDTSLDIDVFKHVLDWFEETSQEVPYCFVHLRPTGPARCIGDINKAIGNFLEDDNLDSLRSVCLAEQTPYKMWLEEEGKLVSVANDPGIKEFHSQPRQELPKVYWQNGYVDIIKAETISNLNSMVGNNCMAFISSKEVKDIDYLSDVPYIEKILEKINEGSLSSLLDTDHGIHSV